jgi:hypothetical protein
LIALHSSSLACTFYILNHAGAYRSVGLSLLIIAIDTLQSDCWQSQMQQKRAFLPK